ncbi:tryptophan halogenase [Burkholderia lata]|uniref:NAD(P)/FAD-dependent oxidoreductase n=1 Tax=Burkholderia lata (strain ATCC 17760 / DSM 23089 / LMG 22485 / NCIMB 9086 / R18194 / 383) TaxID=482957 RepID=UPI001454ABA8|nr:tryptophan 7-halogenase [Burkholderia lata]VWC67579.1 tryptophan halogenase [Burkholderia lata]
MTQGHGIAIVGAGPAGCAAAIALARAGVGPVRLIDTAGHDGGSGERARPAAGGPRPPRFGESLPPDIRLVFAALGLQHAFDTQAFDPCCGSASSWGDDALGYNDFLFNPHGFGWHVERRRFDALLRDCAIRAGAHWTTGRVEQCSATDDGVRLQVALPGGATERVDAAFVVDASGHAACIARAMGAERLDGDRLVCVSACVPVGADSGLGQRSLLEAVEYGWWYVARFSPGEAIVVVATDAQMLRRHALHLPASWHARLRDTRHVAAALGDGVREIPGALTVRQARSTRLSRSAGRRWLAIGDAASSFDPLSSQGVIKAMLDGLAAAREIAGHPAFVAHAATREDRSSGGAPVAGGERGDDAIADRHEQRIGERFADYTRMRDDFYARERRWANAPFWRRRRHRDTTPAAGAIHATETQP